MKIIISPAKKMQTDRETFSVKSSPVFAEEAKRLRQHFQGMNMEELKSIWKCSDKTAQENAERLRKPLGDNFATAALIAYDGIQYKYMAPKILETEQLNYIEKHLRILSGLYGVLRPFDGIESYRLEMQARFEFEGFKNLYGFWGSRLCDFILKEEAEEHNERALIINLASDEYSKAVLPYINGRAEVINISFLKETEKGLKKESTLQKTARGEMVRYMAEFSVDEPDKIKKFNRLGFEFCKKMSDESNLIFIKKNNVIKENDYSWK